MEAVQWYGARFMSAGDEGRWRVDSSKIARVVMLEISTMSAINGLSSSYICAWKYMASSILELLSMSRRKGQMYYPYAICTSPGHHNTLSPLGNGFLPTEVEFYVP